MSSLLNAVVSAVDSPLSLDFTTISATTIAPVIGFFRALTSDIRTCGLIRNSSAERSAVILHGAWLLVISLILSALWASVASDGSLLNPGVSEKEINAIARVTSPSLGFYIGVIALAIVAPKVAAFGYLVIAIVAVVRAPGLSGPAPTTVEPP